MKPITLRDIAEMLGISIGTVDRAIHNRPDVSPATRKRVLDLIEKYHYRPDSTARALSLRANPRRIGVVLIDNPAYNFFWDQVSAGVETAASQLKDSGVKVLVRRVKNESLETAAAVDTLIAEQVDAVIFVPRNNAPARRAAEQLAEAQIPFLTLNDDLEKSARLCYVGPHSRRSGRVAGELMGRFLPSGGRVVLIQNGVKSLDFENRSAGFQEKLHGDFPSLSLLLTITVAGSEDEQAERNDTERLCEELLHLGAIDGIYDASARFLPALSKLKQRESSLSRTVLIGHELSEETRRYLLEGLVTATLSQDPFSQGYAAVRILAEYLRDGTPPPADRIYSRTDILLRENLADEQELFRDSHLR